MKRISYIMIAVFSPFLYSHRIVVFLLFACWLLWLLVHEGCDDGMSCNHAFPKHEEKKTGRKEEHWGWKSKKYGHRLRIVPRNMWNFLFMQIQKSWRNYSWYSIINAITGFSRVSHYYPFTMSGRNSSHNSDFICLPFLSQNKFVTVC